jgi:hypothetical protein
VKTLSLLLCPVRLLGLACLIVGLALLGAPWLVVFAFDWMQSKLLANG